MMKMLILLDEDKIIRENKYSLSKIQNYLERHFEKRNMIKDTDGWYSNGSFSSCGSLIIILSEKRWFMDNIKEWLWMDTTDGSIDDLKDFYKEREVG